MGGDLTEIERWELKKGIVCTRGWRTVSASESRLLFSSYSGWQQHFAHARELYVQESHQRVQDFPPPGSYNAGAVAQKKVLARRASDLWQALFHLSRILEAIMKIVSFPLT